MKIELKLTKPNRVQIIFELFEQLTRLRNVFSTQEKNYSYIKRCRAVGRRPDKLKEVITKSCIKANGEFEIGLIYDVLATCKKIFSNRVIDFQIEDKLKNKLKSNTHKLITDNVYVNEKGDSIRSYQLDAMQIALNNNNGTFLIGTGAGKTLSTALLLHNLFHYKKCKKILVLVPKPGLANQTYNDFCTHLKNFNYKITKWFGDNKLDIDSDIIVAASAIMCSQYKQLDKLLKKIDCIIVDEVHQLKANNSISEIIDNLDTKIKIGFTGTLPDNKHDVWSVKGKTGPVRYILPSSELRDDNYLTQVEVNINNITLDNIPNCIIDNNGNKQPFTYVDEVEWLCSNEQFNTKIVNIINNLKYNSLVLIERLEHGENILELCKNICKNKQIRYITGSVPLDEREDIKQELENNDNLILIAQVTTFSTGISVNNLHNIIFPGLIGKSTVRIVQSIGRLLRLHNNKNLARVIDIVPNTKYCTKHLEERIKIYTKEKIRMNNY